MAFIGLLVFVWWAWSSRRDSQLRLRVDTHREALAEAQRLLTKYAWTEPRERAKRINRLPMEFRDFAFDTLESLAWHCDRTVIPAGLGDTEQLKELFETLAHMRGVESDDPPHAFVKFMRDRMYDETLKSLRESLSYGIKGSIVDPRDRVESLRSRLIQARTVIKWYSRDSDMTGRAMSLKDARALFRQGRDFLRRLRASLPKEDEESVNDTELPGEIYEPEPVNDAVICIACALHGEPGARFCDGCGAAMDSLAGAGVS